MRLLLDLIGNVVVVIVAQTTAVVHRAYKTFEDRSISKVVILKRSLLKGTIIEIRIKTVLICRAFVICEVYTVCAALVS